MQVFPLNFTLFKMEDAGTYRLQANNRNGADKVNNFQLCL